MGRKRKRREREREKRGKDKHKASKGKRKGTGKERKIKPLEQYGLAYFLRAKAECFARLSHRLGVCPSVTLVICIKTAQARITKSSLWTAPRSLVYRDKISCHWVQGFPSNEGVEEGYPTPKKEVILPLLARVMWKRLQIGTYMLLIVTNTDDRLLIYQHWRPWTTLNPSKRGF